MSSPVRALRAFVLLLGVTGCGAEEVGTTRIELRSPSAIDPAAVATVVIAVVHEPTQTCVSPVGSNTCAELRSIEAATKAGGYLRQTTLTSSAGSTATLDGLPRGRVCFVAEARAANSSTIGLGCAEVVLKLDRHQIEIELVES